MDNEKDLNNENIENGDVIENGDMNAENQTNEAPSTSEQNETSQGMNTDGTYAYKDLGGTRLYDSNPDKQTESNRYSYSSYNTYSSETQPAKKKKDNSVMIAVICVCIVFALALSVVAFFVGAMINRTNDDDGFIPGGTYDTNPETEKIISTQKPDDTTKSEVTLPYSENQGVTMNTKDVAAKTVNSVVEIRTEAVVTGSFLGQYTTEGAGSGVIISEDGFIATNYHVIDGATKITVYLRSGEKYEALLWGYDIKNDLAVVKVEAKDLQAATFGNSDSLVVGEEVLAIGNPLGELGGSVSRGIISALSRQVTVENQTMTLLQTDASVNPGNSGGGLFNSSAELIGIVNAKSSGEGIEGIGFAIPSNTARSILQDIIDNQSVSQKASLGVTVGYDQRYGVYISEIVKGSDAERCGLQVNDIILYVDDTRISSTQQLVSVVGSYYVGDTATFVVYRNRETKTITVDFTKKAD